MTSNVDAITAPDSARDAYRSSAIPPGLIVDGRYAIVRELGHGGMGVVYLAHDVDLNRDVALKVIAPAFERDPKLVARFRREAKALAAIRHENVVQVFSFCASEPPSFVMEYVKGPTLGAILVRHKRLNASLPIGRVLTIVKRIAGALDTVHAAGILHRDIKPDNILIEERTGRPVLIDFGLVGQDDNARAVGGYGTPEYTAPELCPGSLRLPATVSSSADVYSFAAATFRLLTGRHVFEAKSQNELYHQQRFERAPAPSAFRAELAPFDATFARALEKDPARRFARAGDFAAMLCASGARWSLGTPPPFSAQPQKSTDRAVNVLIVDDDVEFRRFAERAAVLAFHGRSVSVRSAADGNLALASAAENLPHVVVLDYAMPGLNGLETLACLRELPGGADVRVLVASASSHDEENGRFALLGVNDFVEKPVSMRALVDLVARLRPEAARSVT